MVDTTHLVDHIPIVDPRSIVDPIPMLGPMPINIPHLPIPNGHCKVAFDNAL